MKKTTIWANCLVKNEERWIWFAIMSVIEHVDKILVWDTGSSDKTMEVIKTIKNPKIELKEYGSVTRETYPQARQAQLSYTKSDWMFILDGDEVWTKTGIEKVVETIKEKGEEAESIVVKTINLVGDVYHYQEEEAGKYNIGGRKGHLNLRAMNMKIPGLHAKGAHGVQGYFDKDNKPIQERDPKKILFVPVSYFHMTHLPRSSDSLKEKDVPLRLKKRKYEIGIPLPKEMVYPEVFFLPRPEVVSDPWVKMSSFELMRAAIQTPLKWAKRRIVR